jgi:hypothetical protein
MNDGKLTTEQLKRQMWFRLIVFTLILISIGIYASSVGIAVGGDF